MHHIYIQHIGNGSSDIRFIIEAVTNTSSYKQYLYIQSIITHLKQYIMAIANDLRVFGIPIFAINEWELIFGIATMFVSLADISQRQFH